MFKKFAIVAGILAGGLFIGSGVAEAGDRYRHGRLHDHLDHNEFHRELYHRDAHRYPMGPWQHGRLHDELDHDRFHDELYHRQYHRSYYPSYRSYRSYRSYPHHYGRGGFGIGISPYGFSLRFGH